MQRFRRCFSAWLRGSGNAWPSARLPPKTGNAAASKAGAAFPRNIPDGFLGCLPLSSHSTPCKMYVKNRPKLRLVPSLLLWCCSEVRRITIKINTPLASYSLGKRSKRMSWKGAKTNFTNTRCFVKQKKIVTGLTACASSSDEYRVVGGLLAPKPRFVMGKVFLLGWGLVPTLYQLLSLIWRCTTCECCFWNWQYVLMASYALFGTEEWAISRSPQNTLC